MSAAPDFRPPLRPLAEVCEVVQLVHCGNCPTLPGLPCTISTATGRDGYHVARFARALRRGLITGPELVAALAIPDAFTNATVIYEDGAS
jgi:hypothetical protein